MRWIASLLIAFIFSVMAVVPAQAATTPLKLEKATAQEQGSSLGKVTVKFTLSRPVGSTEGNKFSIVVKSPTGASLGQKALLPGYFNGEVPDIPGTADTHYTVVLVKRVAGRLIPVRVNAVEITATAPMPEPDPSTTDPVTGTGTTGTTIDPSTNCFKFRNTLFGDDICAQDFLTRAYLWAVGVAIIGAAGMIIYAGYKYAVSRGNPSEVNNAKEIIISTLVGLALLVLSYTILQYFGVKVKTPPQSNSSGTSVTVP